MSLDTHTVMRPSLASGVLLAPLLLAGLSSIGIRADTVLDSGTTTVNGAVDFGANLYVGSSNTATLEVVAGGSVINGEGYLGNVAGSTGAAVVSSGTWANSGRLYVGYGGTGTLSVAGGTVANGEGFIGNLAGSAGIATVTGGTWANSGELVIGRIGTGALNVGGGSVTNTDGYVGYYGGGTATVSSGTWANSGDLYVGYNGTAELVVSGGVVSVGGTLSMGTHGTINLAPGGTLQMGIGKARGDLGVPALTNNGTLIFNRSDAYAYSGVLSGSGAVTKQGAGTLTLDGVNSYAGRTTISGGTLALSGAGSIGSGGLSLGTSGVFDIAGLTSGSYPLPTSGNLTGAGMLSGKSHTLAVLGSFLPGNSPGIVTADTGLTLDLKNSISSTFEITDPLYAPGTFDLVNGTGSLVFGGILNLNFSGGTFANGIDVLQLFANTGGLAGAFTQVNSTGLKAGQYATFNAATGSISLVPEPSSYALMAVGMGLTVLILRRKRRAAGKEA
jgi:autotransporter-associated beta strand protein/T5SS/PEP-CTERM-associated repeat protein